MPCYRPVTAYKPPDGGPVLFHEVKGCREIKISCGQCIGCRILKRDGWAIRCLLESQCHSENCFLTLTYDDVHCPDDYSLDYRDVQLFLKRLRKRHGSFRFFACGEYGDQGSRPHYHMLLFGFDPADKRKCNSLYSSSDLFESPSVSELWGKGFATIGGVSLASARYCAAYTVKRITGDLADTYYERVSPITGEIVHVAPEFAHMSLRPGIGSLWFDKYWKDVYATGHNAVVVNGRKHAVPKYFQSRFAEMFPELSEEVKFTQFQEAMLHVEDTSRARLRDREVVAEAKSKFNKERL